MQQAKHPAHFCGSRKGIPRLCYKTPVSFTRLHNRCVVLHKNCVAEAVNVKNANLSSYPLVEFMRVYLQQKKVHPLCAY